MFKSLASLFVILQKELIPSHIAILFDVLTIHIILISTQVWDILKGYSYPFCLNFFHLNNVTLKKVLPFYTAFQIFLLSYSGSINLNNCSIIHVPLCEICFFYEFMNKRKKNNYAAL